LKSQTNTPVPNFRPANSGRLIPFFFQLIKGKLSVLILGILLISITLGAQNRQYLEQQRKQLNAEIRQTNELLSKTRKDKAHALDQYFAVQQQIKKRQQLIDNLRLEIEYANTSIARTEEVLHSLNKDLDILRNEYSIMLRSAFRIKMNKSSLLFMLSAQNFNNAFIRWKYLRQYNDYRQKQARLINETQRSLSVKAEELEFRKMEKEELLNSEEKQKELLRQELSEKNIIIKALKKDESKLSSSLKKQQIAHEELNSTIEDVIKAEMLRKRREGRSPESLNSEITGEGSAPLSKEFSSNKGKLLWPVSGGYINRYFGTQPHPTAEGVKITNNGVDIRTNSASNVFAVFEGKVAGTRFIPGYKNTVILQHGDFYTVYSNIDEPLVKRGDQVSHRQIIGKLATDKPELHFEIWREKQRLNPIYWIKKQG